MSIITNTFTTADAKGLRESLSEVIYDISPMQTPVVSMASKGNAKGTLFEWQTDDLASTDTGNAQIEGDDVTSVPAISTTTRVGNYTQIMRKLILISGSEEAADKAGRKSEMAYQSAKRGKELKRDLEAIVCENLAGLAGNPSSGTARQMATLGAWVKTNVNLGSGGTNPDYTAGVPDTTAGASAPAGREDGTQRAFTETILKDVMSQCYVSGAEPTDLLVGPVNKAKVSAFTGIAIRNFDLSNVSAKPTAVIASIDVYVSDFGTLRVRANRFQRERDAWFLDSEFLGLQHFRPFFIKKLAPTGDAEKRMLLVELGLLVKQEAAFGLAADLTTS